ncbi:hypothetical protein H6P81_006090 [Aristolochia fimbriata]|uniref:Uncharacterized protein n=1 Tax=Aristolochia fimbriata TaxID=158543 RepID=A0AAV7EXI6_ARIFI|nr:hypothetical protein H6P81_006090 [Aristolochia fimbriata]
MALDHPMLTAPAMQPSWTHIRRVPHSSASWPVPLALSALCFIDGRGFLCFWVRCKYIRDIISPVVWLTQDIDALHEYDKARSNAAKQSSINRTTRSARIKNPCCSATLDRASLCIERIGIQFRRCLVCGAPHQVDPSVCHSLKTNPRDDGAVKTVSVRPPNRVSPSIRRASKTNPLDDGAVTTLSVWQSDRVSPSDRRA